MHSFKQSSKLCQKSCPLIVVCCKVKVKNLITCWLVILWSPGIHTWDLSPEKVSDYFVISIEHEKQILQNKSRVCVIC